METEDKREIVSLLINKGVLIDKETLTELNKVEKPLHFKNFIQDTVNDRQEIRFFEILNKYLQRNSLSGEIEEDDKKTSVPSGITKVIFSYE